MQKKTVKDYSLTHQENKPKKLNWKIIAGPPGYELNSAQQYDLIYDERDLKIRGMDTEENMKHFRKKPNE